MTMLCQRCIGTGRILGFGTLTSMRTWVQCPECLGAGFVDARKWLP